MTRLRPRHAGFLLAFCVATSAGCRRGGGFVLINLITGQKTVSVALATDSPLAPLNPFTRYDRMRQALEKETGRPVALDLCLPFQIEVGLAGGFYHFAFVTPAQYAQMSDRARFAVVAVSADTAGRVERPALLIVKANSPIEKVEDLRGKVIAFGRASSSRTHYAALKLLRQHGLGPDDIQKEVLPVPGGLKHMPDDRAVAQTVIAMSSDAGFIDEAYWDRLPAHTDAEGEPARDKVRVIARTHALPDTLLIASPKAEPVLVEQIRAFLLASDEENPRILEPLRVSRYEQANDAALASWVENLPVPPPTTPDEVPEAQEELEAPTEPEAQREP